ncbi:uncharacterized protein H6S33_006281 [Morchella sextelata]|uniref:uncharacterized protein n=1 Tax=Morchella sextelata TaxID=1174677 RepID=UPI001D039CC8|nr:uncharacterized protein H6S33_006281 [Morchella sextelata]KAH0604613.1 hypothetical protein H6S33_006281 [Morchella sextelata]
MFTTAPILAHFNLDRRIMIETDASNYVSVGILSQRDNEGILHPRHHLEGAQFPIEVFSDHRNLEYFMTTKLLNRRQARWSKFLSRFDFIIQFRPGKQGAKPDALTRRSGNLPKERDEWLTHQSQVILKRENLDTRLSLFAGSLSNESAEGASTVEELFSKAYQVDNFPNKILAILRNGIRHSNNISLPECTDDNNGWLLYRGMLYVPDDNDLRLRLLKEHHDKPSTGHSGRAKTLELLNREYYWPQMRKYVDQYIRNCNVCARSKAPRNAPYGILHTIPIPEGPWMDISMDFVTDLLESDGYNAILVVVDRLTKMRHLIPTTKEADSREVARLYIDNFLAEFWKSLCDRLEISLKFSTAFHPQTDGQTERINAVMEQYLRSYLPSKKFNSKLIEPYSVKQIINPYTYELELPRSMKIHPVFHVLLLSPEANNPLPGQQQLPPPPVEIEGEEEWEVEDILDSRKRRGRFEYLVRYIGYHEASCQPLSDLEHSPDIVKRFHERYFHGSTSEYTELRGVGLVKRVLLGSTGFC